MWTTIKTEARFLSGGAGIYEVGVNGMRAFITDRGRILATEGRILSAEDLVTAYNWGRLETEEQREDNKKHPGTNAQESTLDLEEEGDGFVEGYSGLYGDEEDYE